MLINTPSLLSVPKSKPDWLHRIFNSSALTGMMSNGTVANGKEEKVVAEGSSKREKTISHTHCQ